MKEQGHPATASFIWAMAFEAFLSTAEISVLVTLSLKELGKTTKTFLIPHSEKHTGKYKTYRYSGKALNKRYTCSARDGVACE